ncbi:MAG: hypothetical protein FJ387_29645 [Verrucomicrobia bacterium]|nr:hypothetical protein [Verrucomicrobiota bacterium]
MKEERKRWWVVAAYAVAMAWIESAVVLYLRTMLDRLEPYQPEPLPEFAGLAGAEIIREAATLVMLATVGWLAGRTWRSRFGYFLFAFGLWDISYYVFLKPLTGWPRGLLDWDILFLIPLPWWGPVLAPTLIAALMVLGGTLLSQGDTPERPLWPARWASIGCTLGVLLALYTFMADALRVAPEGEAALRRMLPETFKWPLFGLALVLMALPVIDLTRQVWTRRLLARPGGVT